MTGPPPHILIVEDSETQALQLRFLLEEAGCEVVRAASGESALEELIRYLPDLIIADYHLPGIQGDELCRRVRMNVDTRSIPILMLTVEEADSSEQAGLDSGADDYVSKSVTPDILLLRVRSLLRTAKARPAGLSRQDPHFHRARLLAIDDSPTYLECLADSLSEEGYQVTRATGGREGFQRVQEEAFDCAIIDLVMPDMDGIELCRRIHEFERARDHSTAVIMLTARETKEDMTKGLEAGADDFVGKSSDMTVLKARIRALLRRKFFAEENRRIGEQLLRKELEVSEARAARQLAETRAVLFEERAILVEELEQKNKELEAFSYSVSHDLRSPLRGIDGFSAALLEDYGDKLDEQGREYLRRVQAAAQRMGELIDDLLQLSRVGRAELIRRPVDLSALARGVMEELLRTAPERPIQVVIAADVGANADPRLMQVVFENLLGNALKFTARAAAPEIEFGSRRHQGAVVYFVRDNGAGFSMEHAAKLFAPFQRLHSDSEFPGTGIGLATVHRIVERHAGRIWAEAATGKGATFFWTLPGPDSGSTLGSNSGSTPSSKPGSASGSTPGSGPGCTG